MKKIIALLLVLILLCSMTACVSPWARKEVLNSLEGHWKADDQDLTIYGNTVETMGYYEMEGQRVAGVGEIGKITVREDSSFTVDFGGYIREGHLEDPNTLILGKTSYRRN